MAFSFSVANPKKLILISIAAALLIVGGYLGWRYFRTEKLTVSGVVQAEEMKGSSAVGGRVKELLVAEGDKVKKGQLLIVLDAKEIEARLDQAQALVSQAKANKSIVAGGADVSQLQAAREQIRQAEQALKLAQSSGDADVARLKAQATAAQNTLNEAQAAASSAPTMLSEGIISQQRYDQIMADVSAAKSAHLAAQKALGSNGNGAKAEQVAMAQSRLNAARAQYNLLAKGAKSGEISAANASVEQAKGELDAVQSKLDEANIAAQTEGVVSLLAVHAGDLVLPGQPVVTITNATDLWADVYVPEDKLYLVRVGDTVAIHASAFPKKVTFTGKVAHIHPKSEFVAGTDASASESVFRVKLELSPNDTTGRAVLYAGMRIEATFERPGLL